jgi:hypothetical protein
MNLENYQLYIKDELSFFGNNAIFSIYYNEKDLDIKITHTRDDGFSSQTKEMSINELIQSQQKFKNSISKYTNPFSEKLENIINHYNDIKEILNNYEDLKDSFKDIVENKKSKVKNKL